MRIILPVLFFLLLIQSASATIGIGVMPSKIDNMILYYPRIALPLRLWNDGTESAIYTIIPDDSIRPFMASNCAESGYWCDGQTYTITGNTPREQAMNLNILFVKPNDTYIEFDTGFFVSARPVNSVNSSGPISIEPRVFVKIHLMQNNTTLPLPTTTTTITTSTTSATGSTYSGGGGGQTTTTTTTTSGFPRTITTTTTKEIPVNTISGKNTTPPQNNPTTTTAIATNPQILPTWAFFVIIIGIIAFAVTGYYFFFM
jgi:hypothetical protein